MTSRDPMYVAVLGAGMIGIDLVSKIERSPYLRCTMVVARDAEAKGLRRAVAMGCRTSGGGVATLVESGVSFDVVFDATNAMSHDKHWRLLAPSGALMIDLTPSRVGTMVVPTINGTDAHRLGNVNLISCGGQASVPVLHAICALYTPSYVEIVTTAASASVGRATRLNLDEYIATTEDAVRTFTGADYVKAMVNLSPARPAAPFRVALSLLVDGADEKAVTDAVEGVATRVREYAPGYEIAGCRVTDDRIFVAVEVIAAGGRIPGYAGNLDIINCAAIMIAEQYARADAPAA